MESLIKIALGVVTDAAGRVLIILRHAAEQGRDGVPLTWAFPGGKIKEGETIEQAAAREVREETGCEVAPRGIIAAKTHPQFPVYLYYISCVLISNPVPREPAADEVEKVEWVDPRQLKEYFTTDLDESVREFLLCQR